MNTYKFLSYRDPSKWMYHDFASDEDAFVCARWLVQSQELPFVNVYRLVCGQFYFLGRLTFKCNMSHDSVPFHPSVWQAKLSRV